MSYRPPPPPVSMSVTSLPTPASPRLTSLRTDISQAFSFLIDHPASHIIVLNGTPLHQPENHRYIVKATVWAQKLSGQPEQLLLKLALAVTEDKIPEYIVDGWTLSSYVGESALEVILGKVQELAIEKTERIGQGHSGRYEIMKNGTGRLTDLRMEQQQMGQDLTNIEGL